MRIAADVGVQRGDAFGGVDHQQRDVRRLKMLARHHHGELLGHQLGLALAADAGGVDKAVVVALALDHFVHGIARGACDRARRWRGWSSGKRVQQRALAHVGAADDGDLGLALVDTRRGYACGSSAAASSR